GSPWRPEPRSGSRSPVFRRELSSEGCGRGRASRYVSAVEVAIGFCLPCLGLICLCLAWLLDLTSVGSTAYRDSSEPIEHAEADAVSIKIRTEGKRAATGLANEVVAQTCG